MAVPFLPYIGKKGKSRMVLTGFVPWYNVPPRTFPAKKWLRERYGFILPPLAFAPPARPASAAPPEQRRFPALVWLEARQEG